MMNGISRWKVVLYLAAIFAAGGVSGWVVAAKMTKEKLLSSPPPQEISSRFCEKLFSRLNLSPEQTQKIEEISQRSAKEMSAMNDDGRRRIRQARSNRNAQIRAILTPEQQEQFDQIEREHRESYRNKDKDKDRHSRDKNSTGGSGKPPC